MSTRSLLRAALDTRWTSSSQLPPTFLLPWRAQLHQAANSTQFHNTPPEIPPTTLQAPQRPHVSASPRTLSKPRQNQPQPTPLPEAVTSIPTTTTSTPTSVPAQTPIPLLLSPSIQTLLPLLTAQKPHYITAHIHRFPYLLTAGDTLRLPFHMHDVSPGDVLRLNRASVLGSRDYTLKAGSSQPHTETYDGESVSGGPTYIDERLFECRVRVLGADSGPMMLKEKTKRRNRRVKTVRSKHKFTVVRVMEVRVKGIEELKRTGETLVLG